VSTLPKPYVIRALRFVSSALERTRHVDLYVRWARWLLLHHGAALCPGGNAGADILPTLLLLQKNLTEKHDSLSKMYVVESRIDSTSMTDWYLNL
jgi:hypothetical protein